jgi:hypothetical protein
MDLARIVGPSTILEGLLLAFFLLLVLKAPTAGQALASRVEGQASAKLTTSAKQILAVGLVAFAARAMVLPWLGPPAPLVHDEHSLLLQAQTFLAGRLANPTPVLWEHFEAIHLNVVPGYASMYFPGRSLPLLLGMVLANHAWVGVWLSTIAMCMAAVWMLRAWLSAPLALLGGILIVLRLGIFSYWVNSYWGGTLTALGAFLVLGAMPRFLEHRRWRDGLVLAVGASILLVTRPVEGALLCLPVAVTILWCLWRSPNGRASRSLVRLGVPAALLLAVSGGWILSYNAATTGQALKSPYDLNRELYAVTPAFLFLERPDSEQRGPPFFRELYAWEDGYYDARTGPARAARSVAAKIYYNWNFYVGFLLTPAFLAGLWAARRRPFLLATLGFFMTAYMFETWNFPHYTAPIFPVILIILMMGFGWLRQWSPGGRPIGIALTRAMPVGVAISLLVPAGHVVAGWPALGGNHDRSALLPCCSLRTTTPRLEIDRHLRSLPGRDIVLVSPDGHPPHAPMVYNEPDIAGSDIIWAHSLSPRRDAALLAHYRDRRVWRLRWAEEGDSLLGKPVIVEALPRQAGL